LNSEFPGIREALRCVNAYEMIYGEGAEDELHEDFYFPKVETYTLLSTDDASIRLLTDLSRYLDGHRDLVWKD